MVSQPLQDQVNQLIGAAAALMALGLAVGVARAVSKGLAPSPGPALPPQTLLPQVITRRVWISEEEAKRIHDLYQQARDRGLTLTEAYRDVAERMGHSISTIFRVVHRGARGPLAQPVTRERLEEVQRWRRMGLTLERIARLLGYSKTHVLHLLRLAGGLRDPAAEASRLNKQLYAVSEGLWPPVTMDKLVMATLVLKEIGNEAVLLLEMIPQMEEYLKFQLGDIHGRALRAEEVLLNGIWCLREAEAEPLLLRKTELKECADEARYIARGILELWPAYGERVKEVIVQARTLLPGMPQTLELLTAVIPRRGK